MAVCPNCGASIRWVSTQTGRRLALDATPTTGPGLQGWVLDGDTARLADPSRDHSTLPRYRSHWGVCARASAPTEAARTLPVRGPERHRPERG